MINTMQAAIIKKDLRGIVSNKRLFSVLIIVPLVLTVVLPSIFIMGVHLAPEDLGDLQKMLDLLPASVYLETEVRTVISIILNNIMPIFFIIIPIMAASVMAASSFVGEKEKKTLETLLYCPLSLQKIFRSKVLASFLLSMAVSLISFLVMMTVVQIQILLITGSIILPSAIWFIIMLVLSPAVSFLAIILIVAGSAKAQTMEESQQCTVFLILPLMLMIAGQFAGIILINIYFLLGIGVAIALLNVFLIKRAMRKFTYEILLR